LTAAAATGPQAYAAVQGAIASWIGRVVLFGSPKVDHAAIDFQIDFRPDARLCGAWPGVYATAAIIGPKWFTQHRIVS
jgi:hypothetical protein